MLIIRLIIFELVEIINLTTKTLSLLHYYFETPASSFLLNGVMKIFNYIQQSMVINNIIKCVAYKLKFTLSRLQLVQDIRFGICITNLTPVFYELLDK